MVETKQEQRDHAIGQFRLQLNGVFEPFIFYGQDVYIRQAKLEVEKMALALHERLNGKDVPILK
jgi:hypothetical protein